MKLSDFEMLKHWKGFSRRHDKHVDLLVEQSSRRSHREKQRYDASPPAHCEQGNLDV